MTNEQTTPKPHSDGIQRNAYQLTINNPEEHEFPHSRIKRALIENFSTLDYFCMADEIGGETGTYHTHIYAHFTSRVRVAKVKKHFPPAHIDIANGTPIQNIEYIKKAGKWADSEKSETCVEGTFEEWGTVPKSKGKRPDMKELYDMIEQGYSNAEIIKENPDYILSIDKLDKVRATLLIERYKGIRRLNLKVIYISGVTGSGKTRSILDEYGDSAVYKVNDYEHPFDSYACQPVLCFDEFRSQLRISDMLGYIDIYPIELPARYANKVMCAETIFFTSNWDLEMQYKNVQLDDPETWKAFLRRIHEVRMYEQDGSIRVYDSVEKYLNRNSEFHKATNEELNELPFKD